MPDQIRRAGPGDSAALADVAAATFALACPPHVTAESVAMFVAEVLSVARFEAYLADPARVLFVALDDQRATGYAMLVHGEPADPEVAALLTHRPTAELSKLYVRPERHGSGTSRALMAAALGAARDGGASGVWLGVNQLNERAQRFYRRSGFDRVGTKRFLVGQRYEDDFVLEHRL